MEILYNIYYMLCARYIYLLMSVTLTSLQVSSSSHDVRGRDRGKWPETRRVRADLSRKWVEESDPRPGEFVLICLVNVSHKPPQVSDPRHTFHCNIYHIVWFQLGGLFSWGTLRVDSVESPLIRVAHVSVELTVNGICICEIRWNISNWKDIYHNILP